MNEQNNDNQVGENIQLTDLEPIDDVKGGEGVIHPGRIAIITVTVTDNGG